MFRNRIGYWTKKRGLKNKYLAECCQVSEQTFSRWVRNVNQPDLEKAFLLSHLLNISMDELCEHEDQKNHSL